MAASMSIYESALKEIQGLTERRRSRARSRNKMLSLLGNIGTSGDEGGHLGHPVGERSSQAGGGAASRVDRGPVGGAGFDAFLRSIAKQESGSNYSAVGIPTRYGRALGKYQILPNNVRAWSREALGRSVSPEQFLRSPQLQEQIARYKLAQYYKRYGAAGAAKAWYGGEGAARRNSSKRYYGGAHPSLNEYARSVVRRMG